MVNIFSLFLMFVGFFAFPLSLLPADGQISGSLYDLVKIMFVYTGAGCFLAFGSGPFLRIMKRPFGQWSAAIVNALREAFFLAFLGCGTGLIISMGRDSVELIYVAFGSCILGAVRFFYLMGKRLFKKNAPLLFPQFSVSGQASKSPYVNFTPVGGASGDSISDLLEFPMLNAVGDFVVYHGTSDSGKVRKIIREGLKPGNGEAYGTGIYMAESFDDAKEHSTKGGRVFELHIDGNAPFEVYEDLPGDDENEKQMYSNGRIFQKLIWIKSRRWFLCYGSEGQPVQIPGLKKVLVKDYWGNSVNA